MRRSIVMSLACLWVGLFGMARSAQAFELSSWVDLGLRDMPRGYNFSATDPAIEIQTPPSQAELNNAAVVLRNSYALNKIYLLYYRQFEPAAAKQTLSGWKQALARAGGGVVLVPTLLLQDYTANQKCNFSDAELANLLTFFKNDLGARSVALYDVLPTANEAKRNTYCNQSAILTQYFGSNVTRLGLQPSEATLPSFITTAVQDTYGGISGGVTHTDWQRACGWGDNVSARSMLITWVQNRRNAFPVTWDLVSVGYDYTQDKPCGKDAQDEPLPVGRNRLAHDAILAQYPGGTGNTRFGGFSFDAKIIESYGVAQNRDSQGSSLYDSWRAGKVYSGYFARSLNEIAAIFRLYNPVVPASPATTTGSGDFDGDGKVTIYDYAVFVGGYGQSGKPGDMNGDTRIDNQDYDLFVTVFQKAL